MNDDPAHPKQTGNGIPEIAPDRLVGRLDAFLVLDVREPGETARGALPGAVPIPMGQVAGEVDRHPALSDPGAQLVVYCAHGIRSAAVVQYLRQRGFENVWNLAGGFCAWVEHHGPTTPPGR